MHEVKHKELYQTGSQAKEVGDALVVRSLITAPGLNEYPDF